LDSNYLKKSHLQFSYVESLQRSMVAGGDLQEVRATLAQLTWLLTLMAGWG
jgi:hypothetical protein